MKLDYTELLDRDRGRLQSALATTPGLDLRDGYRGSLKCGRRNAQVRFESGDSFDVSLALHSDLPARAALEATAALAGNVRFARRSGALQVVAETRVDGVAHLPETFRGISESIRAAARRRPRPFEDSSSPLPSEAIADALKELPGAGVDVVELDGEWEIRPSGLDGAVPVRVSPNGGGLRLHRTLVSTLPGGTTGAALCEEALRAAGSVRLVRFAVRDGALVVETCLHSGQVSAEWIALAVRAVATVFASCRPHLDILSKNDRVAQCYAELCLPPTARG